MTLNTQRLCKLSSVEAEQIDCRMFGRLADPYLGEHCLTNHWGCWVHASRKGLEGQMEWGCPQWCITRRGGGYLWLCQPCDQITLDIPVHTEFGIPVLSSISHHHHLVHWIHATDEMVVLVYAVICMYMESNPKSIESWHWLALALLHVPLLEVMLVCKYLWRACVWEEYIMWNVTGAKRKPKIGHKIKSKSLINSEINSKIKNWWMWCDKQNGVWCSEGIVGIIINSTWILSNK